MNAQLTVAQIRERLPVCFVAAQEATQKYLRAYPNDWFPCGFAWVTIKNGRSRLAKVLKETFGANRNYSGTGVQLWNPSDCGTQVMYAKLAGCEAFIKALNEQGLLENPTGAVAGSRMD